MRHSRMSIIAQLRLASLLGLAVTVALVGGGIFTVLSRDLEQRVVAEQDADLRVAGLMLEQAFDAAEVTIRNGSVERIAMPALPDLADHRFIDRVTDATGQTATVFAWDADRRDYVRRSTNIRLEDGGRAVGTVLGRDGAVFPVIRAGDTFLGEATILGVDYYTAYEPIFEPGGSVIGILYVGVEKGALVAVLQDTAAMLAVIAALALVAVGVVIWWVTRRIGGRLAAVAEATEALAGGRTDIDIPDRDRGDEVGAIARALVGFRDAIRERLALLEREEAEARARERRAAAFRERTNTFVRTVEAEIETLATATGQLEEAAARMAATAEDTGERTRTVAAASDRAADSVRAVAAATEEMTGSIGEISERVAQASGVSEDAAGQAREAIGQVGRLREGAQRIGEIVTLISDIAEQTNLLALNATIEAARAGEAGKGFAVVATEVKSLATQTAKATEDIRETVQAIQGDVETAVPVMESVGGTIERLAEIATAVAASTQEQSAATTEISRNAQTAAEGTADVSGTIGGLDEGVRTTAGAAEEISTTARALSGQGRDLRDQVAAYVRDIDADTDGDSGGDGAGHGTDSPRAA
ncbi:MAG: methyl-accepting chemotaxis protein [Azospirillaceae bacterium]